MTHHKLRPPRRYNAKKVELQRQYRKTSSSCSHVKVPVSMIWSVLLLAALMVGILLVQTSTSSSDVPVTQEPILLDLHRNKKDVSHRTDPMIRGRRRMNTEAPIMLRQEDHQGNFELSDLSHRTDPMISGTRRMFTEAPIMLRQEDHQGNFELSEADPTPASRSLLVPLTLPTDIDSSKIRKLQSIQLRGACGPIKTTKDVTAANATCTANEANIKLLDEIDMNDYDGKVVVACQTLLYRASLQRLRQEVDVSRMVVGVLSITADRRQSIRDTWAQFLPPANLYFLVAGKWTQPLEQEFKLHQDIIWIDRKESYEELLYASGVLISVIQRHVPNLRSFLKTDDDVYWNLYELHKQVQLDGDFYGQDYFGNCIVVRTAPYRPYQSKALDPYLQKFIINKKTYPERCFEPYCFGWGYVMSKALVDCIARHLGTMRFNPFEDVAVGLLAAKCGFQPITFSNDVQWQHAWTETTWDTNMTGKIMQHPVRTRVDMIARHETAILE